MTSLLDLIFILGFFAEVGNGAGTELRIAIRGADGLHLCLLADVEVDMLTARLTEVIEERYQFVGIHILWNIALQAEIVKR